MKEAGWESLLGTSYYAIASDADKYWIQERDLTVSRNAQASPMLHFKYTPGCDTSINTVEVHPLGADITTCSWSDLRCRLRCI